jgi:hypothetical protein
VEANSEALNRRGRQIRLHVQCISLGGTDGKGVVILMQELGLRPEMPTRH